MKTEASSSILNQALLNETERLKTLLYNAISLLVDETLEQYDDEEAWKDMMCNELDCTREELKKYGGLMF